MATTIKLKFWPSLADGGEGCLFFLITNQRTSCRCATPYRILPNEWNERLEAVVVPQKSSPRYAALTRTRKRLRWEQSALTRLANALIEEDEGITAYEIRDRWCEMAEQLPLFDFMQSAIDRLRCSGRNGTEEKYLSAMRSFERFLGSRDLMLWEVTAELIDEYQHWLTDSDVCLNTVSFYMRILRAVYNRAVRQKLIADASPFASAYTGIAATRKRAIPLDCIQRIKDADLSRNANLQLAKDLFLFSFYCRGMAFVDMAHLTADCIRDGYLIYKRRKTKQTIIIRWEQQMQEIVSKYRCGRRLLPIIRDTGEDEYQQYMRMNKNVNHWLKAVGITVGIGASLTMYVARHSWSSIAKQRNHPIGIISRALGHTSERTTQIYLTSLDNSAVDDANSDIIGSLV